MGLVFLMGITVFTLPFPEESPGTPATLSQEHARPRPAPGPLHLPFSYFDCCPSTVLQVSCLVIWIAVQMSPQLPSPVTFVTWPASLTPLHLPPEVTGLGFPVCPPPSFGKFQ